MKEEGRKHWQFISNGNGKIYGIHDAGIETFSAKIIPSLVREIIQNSLDAIHDLSRPVKVVFQDSIIKSSEVPDSEGLYRAMRCCYESNEDDKDAREFFQHAIALANQDIRVMRISDYNTTGLIGADTGAKGQPWSRLVKESGASGKSETAGGSFGIGKSAAYACSDWRTLFYSSRDTKGIDSHIGVAQLVSFHESPEDKEWTTGIGYYSDSPEKLAVLEQISFNGYRREEPGTDLYILAFSKADNHVEEIIKAVLANFLVSLWKGRLEVEVNGIRIDQHTLGSHIKALDPEEGKAIEDLIYYHQLLTDDSGKVVRIELDSTEYGKDYGFQDRDCTLLLMEGEECNRRVMMTRDAGMKLFEQKNLPGAIFFTGILLMEGKKMNQEFRKMEIPSHDAWEPGRCKGDEKKYERMYKELREYIRAKIKESFAKPPKEEIDAFGMSQYFQHRQAGDGKERKNPTLLGSVLDIIRKDKKKPKEKKSLIIIPIETHPGKGKKKRKKKDEKDGGGAKVPGYRHVELEERIICLDKEQGHYVLNFVIPNDSEKAILRFNIAGEQSAFELPIKDVTVEKGSAHIARYEKNDIILRNLKKNEKIELDLHVDFNQYCLMEADYYEITE